MLFCCPNREWRETAARKTASSAIDKALQMEKRASQQEIKILLLGASQTGKSTILKQFKILYGTGFSDVEKAMFAEAARSNILISAKTLVDAMQALCIPYGFDVNSFQSADSINQRRSMPALEAAQSCESLKTPSITSLASNLRYSNEGSRNTITLEKYGKQVSFSPRVSKFKLASSRSTLNAPRTCVPKDPVAIHAANLFDEIEARKGPRGEVFKAAQLIKDAAYASTFTQELVKAIKLFWTDSGVQYCYSRAREYQLYENTAYFFDEIDRVCSAGYQPTNRDILNTRICTTGASETKFAIEGSIFRIVDCGGQRGERKKWAPFFADVTAILFLVDLSAYDCVCYEDGTTNRMAESLSLFASICNHTLFKSTAIILFLNKMDLFKAKIASIPLSLFFSDYSGKNAYEPAATYFISRFLNMNKLVDRPVTIHQTWATDTRRTQKVLESVRKVLLNSNLRSLGLAV
ncbi:guanine nucleotide binding protein, alpha subunit [Chytriomyces sp. MP71]|nr:guanine nucleotide binding protein, alpha subunit [Chytriomyces sp. MP71]